MNITYKDIPNTLSGARMRKLPSAQFSIPHEHAELSPFNNYQERPINKNSKNLSFEGLLYKDVLDSSKKAVKIFNADEILAITKKHLGTSAEELFNSVRNSDQKLAKEMFHQNGNEISFSKKTIAHLIYEGIIYPIKMLPKEIFNNTIGMLRKFKPLSKWAEKTYNSTSLKNMRQQIKIESKVNALRGLFETVDSLKGKSEEVISSELLKRSVKMFDPKTGNYDTKHERSLNRIVTGSIPAFFLANDAYNLSSMCDNDPKAAKKEKKTRFRQELSRIGLNAYITLVTFGALQKYINNSKFGVVLNIGLTVLFTESMARLTNGKNITRLTPEQAKEINNKKNAENNYNEVYFKSKDDSKSDSKLSKKNTKFKGTSEKTKEEKQKEPLLSFSTLMKASAVVIAAGFGLKGLRKINVVDNLLKKAAEPFNKLYKKLTINPDYTMDTKKFDKIIETLTENGFKELADKYKAVGETANKLKALEDTISESKEFSNVFKEFKKNNKEISSEGFINHILSPDSKHKDFADKYKQILEKIEKENVIHLGIKNRKGKPAVDFVIAPFKFIFNTIKLPYTLVEKAIKGIKKQPPKITDWSKNSVEALTTSIDKMADATVNAKNFNPETFKSFVNDNILKAFNVDNMSNLSNSDLSNLAKTSAAAATIWFLMTDNYNMVMLKSNGEDKEGAKLKFRERFVQEGSRLFYQTLLIDLFNSTFQSQYNKSLWGMTWVSTIDTIIGEILTRKSIGMPVHAHSRDELIQIDNDNANAKGFRKGLYDFMARLTGKKSLAEQRQINEAKKSEKTKKS